MKKNSSQPIFLGIMFFVCIALGLLYAYLFSSLVSMGEDQASLAGKINDAKSTLKQEKDNREALSKYFVAEGEEANFVSSLESFCGTTSLSCLVTSLNELPDVSGQTKTLSAVISALGSREGIELLLGYFESSPYPIVVEKTLINRHDDGVWEGSFNLTVPVLVTNQQ